ncbi:hypothetical protein Pan97_22110 [Bremerella volcania]|uniref:Uncharacterized protein n=1 Tax=Bremerella volcania TaxID=2527984 RepID=A0A518C7H4_9BACT|nr:hypothetical protein Pan97_22110 [Bremerella volcania]
MRLPWNVRCKTKSKRFNYKRVLVTVRFASRPELRPGTKREAAQSIATDDIQIVWRDNGH